jgi:prepilin-type processing-associated H-X9-DG protein
MAKASVICGLVGFCTAGVGGLVGLVLGIVALAKRGGAGRKDHRLAIEGIVVSGASLIVSALVILAVWWAFQEANASSCSCNVQQLAQGLVGYAVKHDGRLPTAETWERELLCDRPTAEPGLRDPAESAPGRCYAMNRFVCGRLLGDIPQRNRTVLLFDCAAGSPPAGGPELLPAKPRHPGGHIIAFCDGHADNVPPEKLGELVWDPGPAIEAGVKPEPLDDYGKAVRLARDLFEEQRYLQAERAAVMALHIRDTPEVHELIREASYQRHLARALEMAKDPSRVGEAIIYLNTYVFPWANGKEKVELRAIKEELVKQLPPQEDGKRGEP